MRPCPGQLGDRARRPLQEQAATWSIHSAPTSAMTAGFRSAAIRRSAPRLAGFSTGNTYVKLIKGSFTDPVSSRHPLHRQPTRTHPRQLHGHSDQEEAQRGEAAGQRLGFDLRFQLARSRPVQLHERRAGPLLGDPLSAVRGPTAPLHQAGAAGLLRRSIAKSSPHRDRTFSKHPGPQDQCFGREAALCMERGPTPVLSSPG